MKTRSGSFGDQRRPDSLHAEPKKSRQGFSEVSGSSGRQVPEKARAANKHKTPLNTYHFQRTRTPGIIEVLNEHFYVMAEYSQRTGSVKWQRIVLASQREQVEKWLEDHYPRA